MAMFNDKPAVRAVMQYLTLGESLKGWLAKGGTFSPHRDTRETQRYLSDVDLKIATEVRRNTTFFAYDASDLMLKGVGQGTFWTGITRYVAGDVPLDEALKEIQTGWAKVK